MRRPKRSRMKEQETSPETELNEPEASNLPNRLQIRMLKELSENFNKEISSIEKDI